MEGPNFEPCAVPPSIELLSLSTCSHYCNNFSSRFCILFYYNSKYNLIQNHNMLCIQKNLFISLPINILLNYFVNIHLLFFPIYHYCAYPLVAASFSQGNGNQWWIILTAHSSSSFLLWHTLNISSVCFHSHFLRQYIFQCHLTAEIVLVYQYVIFRI